MALRNPCFKDPKLVSFEGEPVEREREGREEEEEEKKKKKRRSNKERYGTTWTSNVLNGSPCWYSH